MVPLVAIQPDVLSLLNALDQTSVVYAEIRSSVDTETSLEVFKVNIVPTRHSCLITYDITTTYEVTQKNSSVVYTDQVCERLHSKGVVEMLLRCLLGSDGSLPSFTSKSVFYASPVSHFEELSTIEISAAKRPTGESLAYDRIVRMYGRK